MKPTIRFDGGNTLSTKAFASASAKSILFSVLSEREQRILTLRRKLEKKEEKRLRKIFFDVR